jgi:phage-related tail fiber protein
MGVRPMPDVAQGTLVQEHRRSEVGVLYANTSNQRRAPGYID